MTRKGSPVLQAPVHFTWNNGAPLWSGKLDSNQRPLPPERNAPRRTWSNPVWSPSDDLPSGGLGWPDFLYEGFKTIRQPLSISMTPVDEMGGGGWANAAFGVTASAPFGLSRKGGSGKAAHRISQGE